MLSAHSTLWAPPLRWTVGLQMASLKSKTQMIRAALLTPTPELGSQIIKLHTQGGSGCTEGQRLPKGDVGGRPACGPSGWYDTVMPQWLLFVGALYLEHRGDDERERVAGGHRCAKGGWHR